MCILATLDAVEVECYRAPGVELTPGAMVRYRTEWYPMDYAQPDAKQQVLIWLDPN